jgi:serine/threonine protein kinase
VKTDIWALGVVLTSIIASHHPWEEALSTDWRFSAYQKDPEILLSMLPISLEIHDILKRIFTLDAADRMTLPELRESIMRVQTFFPSGHQDSVPVLRVVNCTTEDRLDSSSSDCDDSSSFCSQSSNGFLSTCSIPQPKRSLSCSDSDWRHLYLNLGDDSDSNSSQVVRWIRRSWTSISPEFVQYSKPISLSSLYDDYWDTGESSEPESSSSSFYSDIGEIRSIAEPVYKPKLVEFGLPDSCLVVDCHTLL